MSLKHINRNEAIFRLKEVKLWVFMEQLNMYVLMGFHGEIRKVYKRHSKNFIENVSD